MDPLSKKYFHQNKRLNYLKLLLNSLVLLILELKNQGIKNEAIQNFKNRVM